MDPEIKPIEVRKPKHYMLANLPKMTGRQYVEWGASLMLVKYGLDSALSNYFFHHAWSFWMYLNPGAFSGAGGLTSSDAWFFVWMLIWALPFAFLGARFTLRRLNTIGLPPWMVLLFFVPFVNMIFFVILAVVKSAPSTEPAPLLQDSGDKAGRDRSALDAVSSDAIPAIESGSTSNQTAARGLSGGSNATGNQIAARPAEPAQYKPSIPGEALALKIVNHMPVDSPRAFLVATLLPVPISVIAAMFSVSMLGVYGWSVFTVVPFVAAISTPVLYGWNQRRTLKQCLLSSITCLMIMASALLLIPFEGVICLAMATPLAIGVGIVGGLTGYAIQQSLPRNEGVPRMLGCFALFLPLMMIGEYISPVEFPTYENVSKIEVNAPPDLVWKYLIDFPRLKEPTEWIFKTGIAYPVEAKINGRGPGAIRECIFTTGKFVEPIKVWNEAKLLRFGVLEQAPPMRELSLYPDLHPPHLDNYLVAKQGQFRLIAIDKNHTDLYGTTWYQNRMGPGPYWRMWSDWIIHSIHMRVLNHVKALAEADYQQNPSGH